MELGFLKLGWSSLDFSGRSDLDEGGVFDFGLELGVFTWSRLRLKQDYRLGNLQLRRFPIILSGSLPYFTLKCKSVMYSVVKYQ